MKRTMNKIILILILSIVYSITTNAAVNRNLEDHKPVRFSQGQVKITKFKIVRVSDGFEIHYDVLCHKHIKLPVYDLRKDNESGYALPERTFVSCPSDYFGKKVFANAGLLIYLENEDAFQKGKTTPQKTFFTETSVLDQYGVEIFRKNFYQNASQDLSLKNLLMFLSTDANSKSKFSRLILKKQIKKINFNLAEEFNVTGDIRIGYMTTIKYND